jgi:hypothetical protein
MMTEMAATRTQSEENMMKVSCLEYFEVKLANDRPTTNLPLCKESSEKFANDVTILVQELIDPDLLGRSKFPLYPLLEAA